MRLGRCLLAAPVAVLLLSSRAFAADATGEGPTTAAPAEATPPALETHVEAAYPEAATRERAEGTVGLELTIDEHGKVVEAKVVTPAGHGFDESALAAAKQFTFAPATEAGKPIRAIVHFDYEFKLPAVSEKPAEPTTPSAPTPVAPPAEKKPEEQKGADQSTIVLGARPMSAASSSSVRDREFLLRPVASVQDILRVTPGLVMVQHSGGGKANQYFLRGFDADHGTDLALSIDGIPINMPSHAHGQGYADTNFVIPEVVERVEISKGPYFAEQGDFATAGAVNLVTRREFEHSSVGMAFGGSPGYGGPGYRALLIASPRWEGRDAGPHALFAAEIGRDDGPFVNPMGWNKYKLFNKVTWDLSPRSSVTIGESSYASDWHGSGQIPARAVADGSISRFGSIDPNEGGDSARHQVFLAYKARPTEKSQFDLLLFAGLYRFDLYSNFTLYLNDPVNGDEIHQVDRRSFEGAQVSYRVVEERAGVRFDTRFGGQLRNDDIQNQLWHTAERQNLSAVRDDDVHETSMGAYAREEITFTKWLRVIGGLRADFFSFAVDDHLEQLGAKTGPTSGVTGATQFSPKASLVLTPLQRADAMVDVYVNYGHGFHSNDARGVVLAPAQRVTPLARAVGEELGVRGRFWQRLDVAAALWRMTLASETVWNGDDGTTQASDATLRYGGEFEARFEILPWLSLDGDVTLTHSQFSKDGENGGGLALAPKSTWSGGVSARHPSGFRGGLRFFGIGDRAANDVTAAELAAGRQRLTAPGFTQVDLHAGYRHRWFDLALDVENLLNGNYRSAQFATVGRLPNEPALGAAPPKSCGPNTNVITNASGGFAGCEDVHFTPAYPFTVRLTATAYLD